MLSIQRQLEESQPENPPVSYPASRLLTGWSMKLVESLENMSLEECQSLHEAPQSLLTPTHWSVDRLLITQLGGPMNRRRKLLRELREHCPCLHRLRELSTRQLRKMGLSTAEATRILAALEIGRRASLPRKRGPYIEGPRDAYAHVALTLAGRSTEMFLTMCLDVRNRPLLLSQSARGSSDRCVVEPREVFVAAVRERASAIIVAHNHPSGDPTPSAADINLTSRLVQIGYLLGIPILDHIIVGTDPAFVSFAEEGLIPSRE